MSALLQQQTPVAIEKAMYPKFDHSAESNRGSDKLMDQVARITGGASGIGNAAAVASLLLTNLRVSAMTCP